VTSKSIRSTTTPAGRCEQESDFLLSFGYQK
jgi:hypothetical protein